MRVTKEIKLADRFFKHVNQTDSCWLWTGARSPLGYGYFRIDGKLQCAHRVVYEKLKGEIPSGMELDHLCRQPSCVNPDHLEAVDHRENLRRGINVGRHRELPTHCPKGHAYTGVNLVVTKQGWRQCRVCNIAAQRKWRANRGSSG